MPSSCPPAEKPQNFFGVFLQFQIGVDRWAALIQLTSFFLSTLTPKLIPSTSHNLHNCVLYLPLRRRCGMLRILIAEDDPDIQELLQTYLFEEGYDTIPAMDGEQALERFHGGQID